MNARLLLRPDIELGTMSLLDYINPFKDTVEQAGKTIDKLVLDKDAALELKTKLQLVELKGEQLALKLEAKQMELDNALAQSKEQTRRMALETKTTPFVDGFHKLSRTLQGFYQQTLAFTVLMCYDWLNIPIDGNTLGILGVGVVTSGIYTWKKQKGAEIK